MKNGQTHRLALALARLAVELGRPEQLQIINAKIANMLITETACNLRRRSQWLIV